ncbi:MAG: TIGR02757 family protein [Nitrospirota bacterium]|nr:MAG: TIGR02757 family protein [Nitrospirota bacterium]
MPKTNNASVLDALYNSFDFERHKLNDPIELPYKYIEKKDREVSAFITALYSYGKVDLFKSHLRRVFGVMGPSPYDYVAGFEPRRGGSELRGLNYRFSSEEDLVRLIVLVKRALEEHGSLEALFMSSYAKGERIRDALIAFIKGLYRYRGNKPVTAGLRHLLTDPARGSACKRLNMFMRWMVRDKDIDMGLWEGVSSGDLVIPLDTHIARIARCIGLTSRKSTDWKTAEEITDALRVLDADDPLKYDFVLCHQGISGICRADRSFCNKCALTVI